MVTTSSVSQGSTGIAIENSVMVASRGRGRSGRGTRGILRNGKGSRGRLICSHWGKEGHLQNRCYDLIGWPDKIANIFSSDTPSNGRTSYQLISDKEYQEFLRLKSNNHTQSSTPPSVSTACISQSTGSQDIWGPSRVTSFGFNYFVTFIDEAAVDDGGWRQTVAVGGEQRWTHRTQAEQNYTMIPS
ncbi:hypothetical protein CR513_05745, partial [Mucuna pruriens]